MKSPYEDIPESAWEMVEITDDYIRARAYLDADRNTWVERTQYLANDLLVKANQEEFKDSETKRWGDGKVVARVPLNVWYSQLRDGVKEGDRDHLSWWLNREENAPFRTFKGKV